MPRKKKEQQQELHHHHLKAKEQELHNIGHVVNSAASSTHVCAANWFAIEELYYF
jgi:hypothetical protein